MSENRMESKVKNSKFTKAILIGALTGAAISLFDKETRSSVTDSGRSIASSFKKFLLHPESVFDQVKEATGTLRNTVEQISDDVSFIADKVDEFKEVPSQLAKMVIDTKESFELGTKSSVDFPKRGKT